ncbi:MAG TPA: STAS domain-containing protein [Terriglobia bacterium]|nr:STAS domain-containing protein [Terriglobia bacterium]
MRIEVKFKDEVAIMSLSGKFLAGSDGPFLRQKVKDLIDAGTRKMVIDFADVPYIDSTGLGFLAGSRVTAQNAGVSLVLASINPHVRKILDGVRLTPFFVLADDEKSAVTKAGEGLAAGQNPDAVQGKGAKKKRPTASGE